MSSISFATSIQDQLRQVEDVLHSQGGDASPALREALTHLLSSGGKRIRPTLGLLVGNMIGSPQEVLIRVSAAVELLHTATLVHDDFIDGSLLRRGIPTLNSQWSSAATVLAGDFFFARAARLAAETQYIPLMQLFSETLAIIVNGEITQLFARKGTSDRKNYYERIFAKTASLFEMSARGAAMLGTQNPKIIDDMAQFGHEIGMAFQMVDDILDFTGEQKTIGKPVGSDLLQGLVTLPTIYYFEENPNNKLVQAFANGELRENELASLVNQIRNSESSKKAFKEAKERVNLALKVLDAYNASAEKDALIDLAYYITDRDL